MSKKGSTFIPTDLDLALQHDPVAEAVNRELLAASRPDGAVDGQQEDGTEPAQSDLPAGGQASREGQRETAAASLAGGMIAAEGRSITTAEAVQKVRAVRDELAKEE